MPEKILGLDIGRKFVKAVQVTAGLKEYRVVNFAVIDIEEAGSVKDALEKLFEDGKFVSGICITAFPAKECSFRNITLPFRDKNKISQVIGFELEPLIPYPVTDCIMDYMIVNNGESAEILVAAVLRNYRDAFVEHLSIAGGKEASVIDIETAPVMAKLLYADIARDNDMLLDIGARETTGIFLKDGKINRIRHFTFGDDSFHGSCSKEAEADAVLLHERTKEARQKFYLEVLRTYRILHGEETEKQSCTIFFTGGGARNPLFQEEMSLFFKIPIEPVDVRKTDTIEFQGGSDKLWDPMVMNQALALATRGTKKDAGFNFGMAGFKSGKVYSVLKREYKWISICIMLILLLIGVDVYLEYHYDRQYAEEMKQETIAIFKKTCPEVTRVVDPLKQLKVQLAEVRKSVSVPNGGGAVDVRVLDVLNDISRLIPQSVDFAMTAFSSDGVTVEIKGETDNFNTVDMIKNQLIQSPYFKDVTINSASLIKKGTRVSMDLKIILQKR